MRATLRGAGTTLLGPGLLAAGLVALVLVDHAATRRELLGLLSDQAASLRHAVAAGARTSLEATRQAEEALSARLLDSGRLLAEIDRRGGLDGPALDAFVERHSLFRVSLVRPDRSLEASAGAAGGPRLRPRARGAGEGLGPPPWSGGASGVRGTGPGSGLLDRLFSGDEDEVAGELHAPRHGEGARLAAGVRRAGGGAVIVTADASALAALRRGVSLEQLLEDVVRASPEVAYVVFQAQGPPLVYGDVPDELPAGEGERVVSVAGASVLDVAGSVATGRAEPASLRVGMRLDGLERAERRVLWLLAASAGAGLALAWLGVGSAWLRRQNTLLSERHERAQAALRRRDRLAAMGELASTVAHEVRNPLNGIAMSVRRLQREFLEATPEAERREYEELLEVIQSETARLDAIVEQFLEFARPRALDPRPCDLAALLRRTVEAVRGHAEAREVGLELEAAAAGVAEVDADQLQQALDNVVRNAVDATPAGGSVRVLGRSSASQHVVEVVDTGEGIPPENLARIFDLYFTTKPRGTGVGLAVSHQIVTAHGGMIEVESQPGHGTRMTLRLPVERGGHA